MSIFAKLSQIVLIYLSVYFRCAMGLQVWSRTKTLQYRCVDDVVRYRQVPFRCDNGETRSHRIRVVRSCTCKRYTAADNRSRDNHRSRDGRQRRTRNRKRSGHQRPSASQTDWVVGSMFVHCIHALHVVTVYKLNITLGILLYIIIIRRRMIRRLDLSI